MPGRLKVWDGAAWQYQVSPPASGSQPGVSIVRAIPFDFDTAGLLAGLTVYTPAVGDLLMDAWFEVVTAFDGTTPLADISCWTSGDDPAYGLFTFRQGAALLSAAGGMPSGYSLFQDPSDYPLSRSISGGAIEAPGRFTLASPLQVCVSTTGHPDGDDPGASVGSAILYIVTATPTTAS